MTVGRAHRFGRLVATAALGWSAAAMAATSPAVACSGASVEVEEIRAEAYRIVVGTIVDRQVRGDVVEAIAIDVDSVIRGESPERLVLGPPTYAGCDGRIDEPVGARLVVATGRQFFDANPPEDLHPYWVVDDDGMAHPAGVEPREASAVPLDELAAWLGGTLASPVAAEEPADGWSSVGSVAAPVVLAGVVIVAGATLVAARRSRAT